MNKKIKISTYSFTLNHFNWGNGLVIRLLQIMYAGPGRKYYEEHNRT